MSNKTLNSAQDYINSLKKLKTPIWAFGKKITEIPDYPLFKPHVDAVAKTYELANRPEFADLMTATSHLTGGKISRFNHIHQSVDDLLRKVRMLRMINQQTACCIQRCAGMDALNATYVVTYELDQKYGTNYHEKFKKYVARVQEENIVVIGAMTDPKGDRSKKPSQLSDPDLYLHIVEEKKDGVVVRGAKAHLTGVTGAHEVLVFPTTNLSKADEDYAIVFSMPVNTPGVTYIFGRQTNDGRKMEEGDIDKGNASYGLVGGECLAVFDDVFVPWENIYMYKQYDFSGYFVERFATAHRQNYGACKGGIADVIIGGTYHIAALNGVDKASAIRDKLIEMIHLTETLYSGSVACSCEGNSTPSGAYVANTTLANCTKLNTTRFVYEINRLAHDICGGLLATLPSEQDYRHPEIGPMIDKYLKGIDGVPTEERIRLFRLIEILTGGTACVEAMHGAGPPQAQRVMLLRDANLPYKAKLAKVLAGVKES